MKNSGSDHRLTPFQLFLLLTITIEDRVKSAINDDFESVRLFDKEDDFEPIENNIGVEYRMSGEVIKY